MFKTVGSLCVLGLVGSLLVACGDGGSGSGASPAGSGTAGAKPASTGAAKPTAAAATPVEMVDHDLSSADPKWAGWTAKGPKDAKVLADGVQGARVAGKGPSILDQKKGGDNGFDIAFAWGKEDLKSLRTNLQKGADNPIGDMKVKLTFTKEEPGLLEWTTEVGEVKSYNFVQHMSVEKTDITCKNNIMIGSGNEAEHKRVMDACKTLAKKAK